MLLFGIISTNLLKCSFAFILYIILYLKALQKLPQFILLFPFVLPWLPVNTHTTMQWSLNEDRNPQLTTPLSQGRRPTVVVPNGGTF